MSSFCCCWFDKKKENTLIDNNNRNERKVIWKRSKQPSTTELNTNNSKSQYDPPSLYEATTQRLSLPSVPAQVDTSKWDESSNVHSVKAGYVSKQGHIVKNWKKRYVVLKDYKLSYYAKKDSKGNLGDESTLKGWISLEGSKVRVDDQPRRINIITIDNDKDLTMEVDSEEEANLWKIALSEAIRASNIKSLMEGYRIPQVVQWYVEEYAAYQSAMAILEFGNSFKLHYTNGMITTLIKVWLQASSNSSGLIFHLSPDGAGGTPDGVSSLKSTDDGKSGKSNVNSYLEGLEIHFSDITNITKGSREHLNKTLGSGSAFFTISTTNDKFVLEVDSRSKRDQWSIALRDVINFTHIPIPRVKTNISGRNDVVRRVTNDDY